MHNSFGQLFRITSFGESHGPAIGVVIDGCPAGIAINMEQVQLELDRRRPGQSRIVTRRDESDRVELLSGIFEGKTIGTPIALLIRNEDAKSKDYEHLRDTFRPSHADYTWHAKYAHRDHRGGGRSSARETAARVAAGAIARQYIAQLGIQVDAYVQQVGPLALSQSYQDLNLDLRWDNAVHCPDPVMSQQMEQFILDIKKQGDTIGGIITGVIRGLPVGLGEPVFDKFHATLGAAMLGINAVKGFEYGSGFAAAKMKGSAHNDLFYTDEQGRIRTKTNHSGGVQGGITNGEDVYFNVAFKPVATILQAQTSVNTTGETVELAGKGRHDPCVVPRAVPIVEAMACLVVADFLLAR
jgi:chorismate synthase